MVHEGWFAFRHKQVAQAMDTVCMHTYTTSGRQMRLNWRFSALRMVKEGNARQHHNQLETHSTQPCAATPGTPKRGLGGKDRTASLETIGINGLMIPVMYGSTSTKTQNLGLVVAHKTGDLKLHQTPFTVT